MYQHVVCFKFKPDAPPEAVNKHLSDFHALQDAISQIVFYEAGRVIETDESKLVYDVVHYLTFNSLEDMAIYSQHEAHQRFIEENSAIWDNVMVLDAEIEK